MAGVILRNLVIPTLRTCRRPLLISARNLQCCHVDPVPLASYTSVRTLCVLAGEEKNANSMNRMIDKNVTLTKLNDAKSAKDVFETVKSHQLNGDEAAFAISLLRKFCVTDESITRDDITQDQSFDKLCGIVERDVLKLTPGSVLSALRNLLHLGVDFKHHLVKSLEHECKWRLRKFSFNHLTVLATFYSQFMKTDSQRSLMRDVVRVVELRWTEITQPRVLLKIMARIGHLSPALVEKLEDRALEMAEQFTLEEASEMAMVLANKNRRSVPLLRSIGYHIMQRQGEFDVRSMMNLSYAFGRLNFHHQQLLEKILAELPPRLPECPPSMVASFAKSFAFLKWLHYPLYSAIAQYTLENLQDFSSRNLTDLLLAFARLNFQPQDPDAFYEQVISALDSGIDRLNTSSTIDTVWSLAILEQAPHRYISRVLSPEYQGKLSEGVSYQIQSLRLKLLHINTTARLESPGYEGPYLPEEFMKPADALINPGRKATSLQAAVLHSLTNTLGGEQFIRSKVLTPYGHKLDAECLVDSDGKPLPVNNYKTFYVEKDGGTEELPPNARRIAVMVWEFQNFCYQSKYLLGRYEMTRRHLTKAGYALAEISYHEWNDLRSEWQRGAYLKDKLNKAIATEIAEK